MAGGLTQKCACTPPEGSIGFLSDEGTSHCMYICHSCRKKMAGVDVVESHITSQAHWEECNQTIRILSGEDRRGRNNLGKAQHIASAYCSHDREDENLWVRPLCPSDFECAALKFP